MEKQIKLRRRNNRRGAMLVLVAISLILLFIGAAFSVDVAYMVLTREQLHIAVDAAAKAAAIALSQGNGTDVARNAGIQCAGSNTVCGSSLTMTSNNVVLGKATYSSNGEHWGFVVGGTPMTAASVSAAVSTSLFFGPVLNVKTFTTTSSATAAFVRNKWCFVFDRSGSMCFDMSGNDWYFPSPVGYHYNYPSSPYYPSSTLSRLAYLNVGANAFINALLTSTGGTAQNKVGMVTFASSANVDCTFSYDYTPVQTKLSYYLTTNIYKTGIYNGGTNLYAGLQSAINLFSSTDDGTPWNKVIIVFSDGQWNQGSDPLNLVSQALTAGITIHTVGLLPQANNYTMQQLPAQTGGQFYYATSGAALIAAFQKLAQTIPVILTQ
jgi:Ca-activated chloride channel homolog